MTLEKNKHSKLLSLILFSAVMILSAQFVVAQSAVDLGTAGNFILLAKSGISTTGTTSIIGNLGVSPAAASFITGFGLIQDSSNQFGTSSLVTGKIYAADYTPPTPASLTLAVSDMEKAYADAAGRTLPDYTELGTGIIGEMTLTPGLYKWGTDVLIPTDIFLDCQGDTNAVFIFQIAGNLDISAGKQVILKNGCQAKNIFWQVAGQTTLGTTSVFTGNVLDKSAIVLNTGATLNGRAFAQTAVTLDANRVSSFAPLTTDGDNGQVPLFLTDIDAKNDVALSNAEVSQGITLTNGQNAPPSYEKSDQTKEEMIARMNLRTGLNMSLREDESLGSVLRASLSNGNYATVRVLPAEASLTAQENLKMKCAEANCTVELKEVKVKKEKKAVYEVKAKKDAKLFGFMKVKQKVSAQIDVETGDVVNIHKPWWSFLAKEQN